MLSHQKTVLITGHSHGIGYAITEELLKAGYKVIAISRSSIAPHDNLIQIEFDLTNTTKLSALIENLKKTYSFSLLINNAGAAYYGPHEQLSPAMLHEMVTTNLEVPMLLASLLLRQLKENKGMIVNISSITGKKRGNTHGVAYGATKAGLTSFGESLFDETRKSGLRVINIHPDLTGTELYRNADFTASKAEGAALSAKAVAEAVMYAINAPEGIEVSDITLMPQFNRIDKR